MDAILAHHHETYAELVLNRPDKRNAIRVQMLHALADAIQEAEQNPAVRVILLRGEGQCFSAGLDFMTMGGMPEILGDTWMHQGLRATRLWQTPIQAVRQSRLPIVALLHGYTLGAGLELALACDLRIAAEDTLLSLEEARLGMIPDEGGTTHLTQLVGASRAKELILTGKRIDAATALQWGLINQMVPGDALQQAGLAMVDEIAQAAPLAVAAAKRVINAIEDNTAGLHLEMVEQQPLFRSEDLAEGMQSRLERRPARWVGR